MIFVDDRSGSAHFAPLLQKAGIEVELMRLDFGDLFFVGRGEGGAPVDVGIEFKNLADFIASVRSERLQGHQLPGMRAAQPGEKPLFDYAYLLVEGDLTYDKPGMLQRRSARGLVPYAGKMTINELFKRTNSIHLVGGLTPMFTRTQADSVQWIAALYRSWTDVDLDEHKSHLGCHNPKPLVPLSRFQQAFMNAAFPGIGRAVAKAAEKKFKGSIRRAVNASVEEWAALETVNKGKKRKFGESSARRLVEAMK